MCENATRFFHSLLPLRGPLSEVHPHLSAPSPSGTFAAKGMIRLEAPQTPLEFYPLFVMGGAGDGGGFDNL